MYDVHILTCMVNGAVQCSPVQCSAVQCSAVQCNPVQCSAVQFNAVQCSSRGHASVRLPDVLQT